MKSLTLAVRTYVTDRVREGARFRRLLADLEARSTWDEAQIRAYQDHALARVFAWCADVPAYDGRLAGAGDPRARLAALPLLDKDAVRARNDAFRPRGWAGRFVRRGYTSGSTGTPLVCFRDAAAITFENAALWRIYRWAGIAPGDRRVILRGDLVVPASRREPPFWSSASARVLHMSSYHLAPQSLAAYVAALRAFAPASLHAYPSSVALLAHWLLERGETLPLKAVVTSSETLLDDQREAIERAFACPVLDYYGNAERTTLIARCERGAYHVCWDYALTEFLPDASGDVEIVGTPLFNRAMPLLRYRSGDGIEHGPTGDRCPCGRTFPVVGRPQGRRDVYVRTPDGRRIGRLDHVFKGMRHIREGQIEQTALDRLLVRVAVDDAFAAGDRAQLIAQTRERVGAGMHVEVEVVDRIERGPRGKFAAIVSTLPPEGVLR